MELLAGGLAEHASEARRLAESKPAEVKPRRSDTYGTPAEAVAVATYVIDQARRDRDYVSWAAAEQALGVAALRLEDPDAALRHMRTAVRLGQRRLHDHQGGVGEPLAEPGADLVAEHVEPGFHGFLTRVVVLNDHEMPLTPLV